MMKKQKIAKHVIVISYDAFSEDNWNEAKSLTNMSKLISAGAFSSKLKSVCPTLTYVAHTTMVTGVYPDKHGVLHNNPLQPFVKEKNQKWYWFRDSIKVPTIYDALKNANMKTAGILWPVSGDASIKYNLPEIVAINGENQALKLLKHGSPFFCIEKAIKFGHLIIKGIQQPFLDNFSTQCAIDTIKRKKPNLLLLHLIDLDNTKHKYGIDGPEVSIVLKRMDNRIGDIIDAVNKAGLIEETVFIVIGDHGQKNIHYKVHINNFLEVNGLIYEENGTKKWRAYFQSTGGAAYLHIKQGDIEAEKICTELVNSLIVEGKYGIEALCDREELDKNNVHGSVNYMISAKEGYEFVDDLSPVYIDDIREKGIRRGNHGYFPSIENYRCNLIISGAKIKNCFQLEDIEMVDIAPTIAKILGIEFDNCDGRSLDEIFADC